MSTSTSYAQRIYNFFDGSLPMRLYRLFFVLSRKAMVARIARKLRTKKGQQESQSAAEHPFDLVHGIQTHGLVGYRALWSGKPQDVYNADYGPSQPSLVRKAISLCPDIEQAVFVDFGCGKGRALAVASEFPFREIIGVELAPAMADIARQNAAAVRERWPDRTPIRIVEDDAGGFPLPDGYLVIFMYDPFFEPIMKKVVRNIEAFARRRPGNKAFVIYCKPDLHHLFDSNPLFSRYFAEELDYDDDEKQASNWSGVQSDPTVIWQSRHEAMVPPFPGAESRIARAGVGGRICVVQDN